MPLPMMKGGFLRMVLVALGAAGFAVLVLAAAVFGIDGAAFVNIASAFAAAVAVVMAQLLVMSAPFAKYGDVRRFFMLWVMKFSMMFLFIALAARGLSALSMLSAPGFVFGVVVGIGVNLYTAARMTMQFASYNKRQV